MGTRAHGGTSGKGRYPRPSRDGSRVRKKVYEVYLDENGKQIEWHYWIDPDGILDGGKIVFPGTTSRVGLAE
jgi:hypothetical protein